MNSRLSAIVIIVSSLAFKAEASHIVGGEVTYKFMGDSAGLHRYRVFLSIYEDCHNGQPEAIAEDNPAYLAVYKAGTPILISADSVRFSTAVSVPANFTNACVSNIPVTCLTKKTFVMNYALSPNSSGYIVDYQRCCRNNAVMNILDPGNKGSTYFCYIPPSVTNNSAVFKNYPPQIICLNNPLVYDHSATDADGDSLSYGFATALQGASDVSIKPWPPGPPPFDTVVYTPPFTAKQPMTGYPPIQIDPVTGLITGTPNRLGRFLVTIYCNEYRGGTLINTITREFQFVVTDCSKVVVADIPQYSTEPNTYVVDCQDYNVNFVNASSGGFSYLWNFGVPGSNTDTSTSFQPTFVYPDTGTFAVKLIVNPSSTCPDSITRLVKVYPRFHAAYFDSGSACPGSPISFVDQSSATIKPVTYWKWSFGDGDSAIERNPVHMYNLGGVYNVILISKNFKGCTDTIMKQLVIDNFTPFAGNDTFVVKGEKVQFHATGGTKFSWSPPDYLSDTSIFDPVGIYPDTGHYKYTVFVTNPFGCSGYDTVCVTVVNQAAFAVPTAFTPNGDGNNDYFKPLAIGYKDLGYFRVFNRWGQEVFFTTNLETGWNGTFHDKAADVGTYFWELSYTDRFGAKGKMKGDVVLIR